MKAKRTRTTLLVAGLVGVHVLMGIGCWLLWLVEPTLGIFGAVAFLAMSAPWYRLLLKRPR